MLLFCMCFQGLPLLTGRPVDTCSQEGDECRVSNTCIQEEDECRASNSCSQEMNVS